MKVKRDSLPSQKHIALVAHDNLKGKLVEWCLQHSATLQQHRLYATGTTGNQIEQSTGLAIEKLISGPLGGDQQIGAKISEGEIHLLIFFWDPLASMPHDPDIKALLRIAAVWNIPVACNISTADMLLASPLLCTAYEREVPDYDAYLEVRAAPPTVD